MTTAIATPPIQGLKALNYPPNLGEHYLSVDLAQVEDVIRVFDLAKELGFSAELVQISTGAGTTEIHALLFYEQTNGEPFVATLDDQLYRLAEEINTDAIRHCYGGRLLAA
jgi:hypothetical protein